MKKLFAQLLSTSLATTPDSVDPVQGDQVPPLASEQKATERRAPVWARFAPFLLSGLFFYSVIFAVFSPIPLLMLFLKGGFGPLFLAVLTNSVLVTVLGGFPALSLYLVFVAALGVSLPFWAYSRRQKPDRTILLTFFTMALTAVAILCGYSWSRGLSPVSEAHRLITQTVDFMVKVSTSQNPSSLGDIPIDELKKGMVAEFPSLLGVFALLMSWINFVMFFRMNPLRMRESLGIEFSYFKTWKASEWLVWPTIVCGALLLFSKGAPYVTALNLLKFSLVVYGLQGVSILAFVFDYLKVRGMVRTLLYVVTTFFMTPFLIGLGFFDLWFDFRSKLRQS